MKISSRVIAGCFVIATAALFICGAVAAVLSIFTLIHAAKIAVSITISFIALSIILFILLFADAYMEIVNASDDNQSTRR